MQALLLEQQDGKTLASVQTLDESRLPEGDVTVDVHWSSLNYKDALAITGKGKIIRNFPMIPGIDFAGTVRTSEDPRFHAGQEVLLTGWGVGENHWGGLAEQARVKGDWLVAMPHRDRWLYRHAVRDGAGRCRCSPAGRGDCRDGCQWWRRQYRRGAAA